MVFIVDIDDTLIESKEEKKCDACGRVGYRGAKPIQNEIDLVNKAFSQGHTIILSTARSWDIYHITIMQLLKFGIKHHTLIMGKPTGYNIDATNNFKSIKEITDDKQ